MPTYEYKCKRKNCGLEIECIQKLSEDPLVYCPHCGKKSLKKMVSKSTFVLKGPGWTNKISNDYGS